MTPGRTALIRTLSPCVLARHFMRWSCAHFVIEYAMELPERESPCRRSSVTLLYLITGLFGDVVRSNVHLEETRVEATHSDGTVSYTHLTLPTKRIV